MKLYIGFDDHRNVANLATFSSSLTPTVVENKSLETLERLEGFYISNGELLFSEEVYKANIEAKEEIEAQKTATENLEYLKNKEFLDSLDDEAALMVAVLYPQYQAGIKYKTGNRFRSDKILYRVLVDHVSQEDWIPSESPSLYAKVLIEDPDVVPEWEQPESTNGYAKGDQVIHNSIKYESLTDNNVWEPGAEGTESLWKVVTE